MSFTAKMKIDGDEVNVLHCSFRFTEATAATGLPTSIPRGGSLKLVIESDGDTVFFDWMIDPTQTKSGIITFFRRDALSKMKTLQFKDAYCVSYYETFDHKGDNPMQIQLTINANELKLNDSQFKNHWVESGDEGTDDAAANAPPAMTYENKVEKSGTKDEEAPVKPEHKEGPGNSVATGVVTAIVMGDDKGLVEIISSEIVKHADIGDFPKPKNPKKRNVPETMRSGGHGQNNILYLKTIGMTYNIVHVFSNGVRIGNIPKHKNEMKSIGTGQSWFPENWSENDIKLAGEHVVLSTPDFNKIPDGQAAYSEFKGVRVGIIKTKGKVGTIFPDGSQQGDETY